MSHFHKNMLECLMGYRDLNFLLIKLSMMHNLDFIDPQRRALEYLEGLDYIV